MGCIWCVRCENIRGDIAARTCALIAPARPVLRLSSSYNGMVRNAPKHEIGVQVGASGVFVVKNSYAISLDELVH
jgi:hypothetical protein